MTKGIVSKVLVLVIIQIMNECEIMYNHKVRLFILVLDFNPVQFNTGRALYWFNM